MENITNLDLFFNRFHDCGIISNNIIVLLVFMFVAGCGNKAIIYTEKNEIVLTPGMEISAENIYGTLIITAGENYHRSFYWKGESRSVYMLPRTERWNNSFGLYFPGRGRHWAEHDGVTRAVVEEGQLNFESNSSLMEFIDRYEDKDKMVYSDKGLFVYWDKESGADGTLNVQIWQFLIKGNKPNRIHGSDNTKIAVLK